MTVTPSDILTHLKTYMPVVSDDFTDTLVTTAVAEDSTVTFTSVAHGLTVGSSIGIAGSVFENSIASFTDNDDGTVRFSTTYEHDFTEAKDLEDPTTLTLSGFDDTLWNGIHTITSIPNRMTFEIDIPAGAPVPPGLTGAIVLEDRSAGLIGVHTVATVTDADTFTVIFADVPPFPTGAVTSVKVISGYRIYSAANIVRAQQVITGMDIGKLSMFLIMNDADISKDRHALNDAVSSDTSQNYGRQLMLQNFSIVIFFPTQDGDVSGGIAQSQAYGKTFKELYSAVAGHRVIDTSTPIQYLTVCNGHGTGEYNSAYYIHVYDWQLPTILTFEDSVNTQPNVAFRDTNLSLNQGGQLLNAEIDLDKEPL